MFYESYTLGSIYTDWGSQQKSPMDPNVEPTMANRVT